MMRIPKYRINYHYIDQTPLRIRFGKGRDGVYFFEIVTRLDGGIGYAFSSSLHGGEKWAEFMLYITALPRPERMKVIRRVLTHMQRMIKRTGAPYGGCEKFTIKRLFHSYKIRATNATPDTM
ncbi:MAG: hypothetical protein ACOCVN_03470 [bacterium]